MKRTILEKMMLLGLALVGGIMAAQAKTTLTFSGLVEEKIAVTKDGTMITAPQVLVDAIGTTYTLTFNASKSQELYPSGLTITTDGKYDANAFTLGGLSEGDQVTITLDVATGRIKVKGGCTMNGNNITSATNCSAYNDGGTYAYVMTVNAGVTSLSFENATNSRYSRIATIEIVPAAEATPQDVVSNPTISCTDGTVTITPGTSSLDNPTTTYYTTDGTMPSTTNGTAGTTFAVTTPTVVKAITVTSEAQSDVVTQLCAPTTPRAKTLDLTTVNTGSSVTLTSTGCKAASYTYANEYLEALYGTLAFSNPSQWTLGTSGLTSAAANNIFEIPNLKEGDKVTVTISSGRLQLYGQSTSNHLVDGRTPSDGYANISKAGDEGYCYEVTMLNDANLKVCTKDAAVTITAIIVTEKEEEHYEMPDERHETVQNRGLWACQTADGEKTFVSWRTRKTDNANTSYILYRNGAVYDTFTTKTNVTIDGTASTYTTDTYKVEVIQDGSADESQTMTLATGSVKPHNWFRIKLADEPVVTNTGVMWDADGKDTGYKVRYTPNDMSCYDMDGDGQEELIVKWEPSNAQDNGRSGYTANVYIDCYKVDYQQAMTGNDMEAQLLWRINLGQNIRAGAHYTQFLCYDFDGDGKGEMMVKTSLGTKDGLGNYVFQSRITERSLDVTRDYTRQDDSGASQSSNGHIGVGEEWLTVFRGSDGKELATTDYYPKFNVVSDWHEPTGSSNRYNKGTRFKACVAFLDGQNPSGVFNRGYYSQSFFTAYNWNGTNLYEVWRHASTTPGEGMYAQGNHSLVVDDFDGDGFDEIGVGSAALDHDGTVLWTSGFGHGDAHHLGDFDPNNEGLEIFYVNEEWKESPLSSVLFDAATGGILKSHPQDGMDTGRGLAADLSAAHRGAEMITKGDDDTMGSAANGSTFRMQYTDGTPDWVGGNGERAWQNGSLYVNYVTQDEFGQDVTNTVASYPNFRIYWDGDLLDEWLDSRHVDKMNDETRTWERVYTFDSPSHTAHSINGTKENPNLITDLFGDWREEVIFYDYDVTGTTTKSVTSKSENNGEPFDYEWEQRQFYLTVFTTTIPTEHSLPWLRDDHAYDMSIAWQNVGYNQPPHLSYSPLERMNGTEQMVTVTISSVGVSTYSNKTAVDFSQTGSDLIVYAANLNAEETAVTLTPIASKQIPANTAVILVGEAGKIYEGVFTDEAEAVSSNMQAAPFNITVGTDDQFLGLGVKNGQPIFAKMKAGATIKARTGYFQYLLPATAESRAIRILFEETTGISTVNSEEVKAKSEVYNLLGRKVSQPGPGLYIQNGRKIIIK